MKHDQKAFAAAYGQRDIVADRVTRFVPMVQKAAWHIYGGGCDGLDVDDLMQAGFIALTECAQNHDGPGEDGFAAYAKIRVRGAMFDLVRKTMPESRQRVQRRRRVEEARARLEQQLGRPATPPELAEALGIPLAELPAFDTEAVQLSSIDAVEHDSHAAFRSDAPDAFDLLAALQDNERLGDAVAQLPERLQLVLQLYFVEELNLTEIAAVLEVSVPRVHQLKMDALAKLKAIMAAD